MIIPALTAAAAFVGKQWSNAASAKQASENRAFQEKMSNTAHQREVADLRKAGINPMLSAKSGGASSPSGSVAPVEDALGPAVNSAIAATANQAQVKNMEANTALASANARKAAVEANQIEDSDMLSWKARIQELDNTIASGQLQKNEIEKGKQEIEMIKAQIKQAQINNQNSAAELDYGKYAPYIKPLIKGGKEVRKFFQSKKK